LALHVSVHQELALKTLSYGLIGILWGVGFVVLLISARKGNRQGEPLRGMAIFFMAVVILSALAALLTAQFQYHVW
jgi:hypothetical protein